jgi:hypothetical protein
MSHQDSQIEEPTEAQNAQAIEFGVRWVRTPWRQGDWSCPVCKYHCYGKTLVCNEAAVTGCTGAREDSIPIVGKKNSNRKFELCGDEWVCWYPRCSQINFGNRKECYQCKLKRDINSMPLAKVAECVRQHRAGRANGMRRGPGAVTNRYVATEAGRQRSMSEAAEIRTQPY